tara:strand:+ start:846 stop:1574 length:729 start_codon:yes stop_codon:yes gene_type:complete
MTISEMHYDFKVKLDKVASQTKEDFNVAEIDWLLNEAQDVFIKQRYGLNNPHRTGFEVTQKRIDDLSSLHVKQPEQVGITPTLTSGVYEVPLSSLTHTYLFYTRGSVDVTVTNCPTTTMQLRHIQADDLSDALRDPFNQSSITDGVLFNFGKSSGNLATTSIYIYPGTLTLGDVYIEYIKHPRQMFFGTYTYIDGSTTTLTNCELPEHTHSEMVDQAVLIASGIIEHPTYQQMKKQKVFNQE